MQLIDFIIGLTLVNSLPHFVLGVWKGRMFSGLGFGDKNNIGYSLINFVISIGLFLFQYGFSALWENSMYLGGLFVVVAYYAVGHVCYRYFHVKHYEQQLGESANAQ
ncbi:MAG: hypothetical protein AAF587_08365 [Bacteroidota bacterium]